MATVRQNKYGQTTMSLSNPAYQTFAKPVLPYLAGPYQYVQPYVRKADEIGDKTLSRLDENFPVVKKPTAEVYSDTKSVVTYPYRKGLEGKDHVVHVYVDERKQIGGEGIIPLGKTLFTTALVITAQTLGFVRTFLTTAKEQATEKVN